MQILGKIGQIANLFDMPFNIILMLQLS